jgi:hypothetical protein
VATNPQHRYLAAQAAVDAASAAPEGDAAVQALFTLLGTGVCEDAAVTYALDLFRVDDHRSALDAFLLAQVSDDIAASTLSIAPNIVAMYRHLFMDTTVFRNKLELMTYARNYTGNAYGVELVRTAVTVGLEYLLWAFGKSGDSLDNRAVVRQTMVDSFFRGMAHKGNPITSATAKEAQKWWATAIRNAQILETIDPRTSRNAYEELRMALEKTDDTKTVEQAPVPLVEILH